MSELLRDILPLKAPEVWAASKLVAADHCSNPTLLAGVEIETENIPAAHGPAWYIKNLSTIWGLVEDGSLRGRAWEFISKPAELRILIPEISQFFGTTKYTTEENYTDRTSIHVHTNVQDFTPYQLAALGLVYSVVEEVLFEFINHFKVDDPRGKYRDTNLYCVPWNQCRMNHKIITNMFSDINHSFKNWQKYTALNLIPVRTQGTVEWRHLHGTADTEKITLWLNLIGCIMRYSKDKKFEDVVKTIKELNDTSTYRQFFNDVLGGYLPYDNKYEKALAAGVINAKYALIGMKEYVFKAPKKLDPKKPAVHFDLFVDGTTNAPVAAIGEEEETEGRELANAVRRLEGFIQRGDEAARLFRGGLGDNPPPPRAVVPPPPQVRMVDVNNAMAPEYYPLRRGTALLGRGMQAIRQNILWSDGMQQYINPMTKVRIPENNVRGWQGERDLTGGLSYAAGILDDFNTLVSRTWRPMVW